MENIITAENYLKDTSGYFSLVDKQEIKRIQALKPDREEFKKFVLYNDELDDEDWYDEDNKILYYTKNKKGGICTQVHANVHLKEEDFYLVSDEEPSSRTWVVDGVIYRESATWGKIGSCNWELYNQNEYGEVVMGWINLNRLERINIKVNTLKKEIEYFTGLEIIKNSKECNNGVKTPVKHYSETDNYYLITPSFDPCTEYKIIIKADTEEKAIEELIKNYGYKKEELTTDYSISRYADCYGCTLLNEEGVIKEWYQYCKNFPRVYKDSKGTKYNIDVEIEDIFSDNTITTENKMCSLSIGFVYRSCKEIGRGVVHFIGETFECVINDDNIFR